MASKLGTYDTQSAKEISVEGVSGLLKNLGCTHIYVKELAPNDNSKNQPYFGSHLTDLPRAIGFKISCNYNLDEVLVVSFLF